MKSIDAGIDIFIVVLVKRTLLFVIMAAASVRARAEDPFQGHILSSDRPESKSLHAILAKDKGSEPMASFSADTLKIETLWRGTGLKTGDRIHAVWIAEDVGAAAPKESKVTEASVTVSRLDEDGAFILTRPKEDSWPVGKYRLELYLNGKLAQTLKFTIAPGVTIEVAHERN